MRPTVSSKLRRLRESPIAAYVGPFAVFMILLEVTGFFRIENSHLPWWRQYPEHWGYPLQTFVCLALLWWWRKHYPPFKKQGLGLGIITGIIGIALWLIPPTIHHFTQIGDSNPWLKWIGITERTEGFNPYIFDPSTQTTAHFTTLLFRFIRLVIVVALVEEVFWRGFLMRYLGQTKPVWNHEPIGQYSRFSFWITSLLFASVHFGPDFMTAFIYGSLAGWVTLRTGNLWAVVTMHATSNLCLGIFILATRWWGLW